MTADLAATDRAPVVMGVDGLDALIGLLAERGHRVVGPSLVDGVIRLVEVSGVAELPAGVGDEQAPGRYRTRRGDDPTLFSWAVGPDSARRVIDPPKRVLVHIRRREGHLEVTTPDPVADPPTALIGLRGCDVAGLAVSARVLAEGDHPDPFTTGVLERAFVVAVDCAVPASTCFCTSMGTGPAVGPGADLVLSELNDADGHRFLCRADSGKGAEVLAALAERSTVRPSSPADAAAASASTASAAAAITRRLDTVDLPGRLLASLDAPAWSTVADTCLACGNCTLVCPTCFCGDVVDSSALSGEEAVRERIWDSCFTSGHSYLHGGSVRSDTTSRYRQWMTHKLATWHEQFGTSGCVGCGRCVTWCPVGIDLVAEATTLARVATAAPDPAEPSSPSPSPGETPR